MCTQTHNYDMIFQTHKHIIRECAVSSCAKTMYSRHQKKYVLKSVLYNDFFFCTERNYSRKNKNKTKRYGS